MTDDGSDRPPSPFSLEIEARISEANPTLDELSAFAQRSGAPLARQDLVESACKMYESRRLRARFLSVSLLGEPVWDMLLALYCFSARGEALSVSGLCYAAGVPPTTALRWAHLLEQKKLIERTRDSRDRRRAILTLSENGEALMSNYLATINRRAVGDPPMD